MRVSEYLLNKLAEEAMEVGQRVAKALAFGLNETQQGQPLTNAERLNYELNDLHGVLALLNLYGIFTFKPDPEAQAAKMDKVEHFMEYSRTLGVLGPKEREEPGQTYNCQLFCVECGKAEDAPIHRGLGGHKFKVRR